MNSKINVNDQVKVRLTKLGIKILEERHNELNEFIKLNGGQGLKEFKVQIDEEGYSSFQLWGFMNTFGEYMTLASEMPFEAEMIVEPVDLEYLISIEKSYGQLVNEHAELVRFKEVANKHLTAKQLSKIQDETENIADTD